MNNVPIENGNVVIDHDEVGTTLLRCLQHTENFAKSSYLHTLAVIDIGASSWLNILGKLYLLSIWSKHVNMCSMYNFSQELGTFIWSLWLKAYCMEEADVYLFSTQNYFNVMLDEVMLM